ncbi:hypothetical protein CANARDRAFT_27344 [[Candida] arabinofermentans NRRL YB-2248]|uniref:Uncharacterized protein n=1 Tax=[Candida] arabinofermentans NRRL YB-2248 TaxID=983967 RepID=A0A1E4T5H0_9ASCO|nr:hypothetical protein CANARDRAFT_27344 [[Candida] arabinofermentans NRRL YB-2248]
MDITKLNNPITSMESLNSTTSSTSTPAIPNDASLPKNDNNIKENNDFHTEVKEPASQITASESSSSSVTPLEGHKKRTTKEYRMLYYYLLTKYRTINEDSKSLKSLESRLDKLIRYSEMRNNMLSNLIAYIDNEEIKPINDKITKSDEMIKLGRILDAKPQLESVLSPLFGPTIGHDESDIDEPTLDEDLEKLSPRAELAEYLDLLKSNSISTTYDPETFSEIFNDVRRNKFYNHQPKKRKLAKKTDLEQDKDIDTVKKVKKQPTTTSSKKAKKQKLETPDSDIDYVPSSSSKSKNVILKFDNKHRLSQVTGKTRSESLKSQSDELQQEDATPLITTTTDATAAADDDDKTVGFEREATIDDEDGDIELTSIHATESAPLKEAQTDNTTPIEQNVNGSGNIYPVEQVTTN